MFRESSMQTPPVCSSENDRNALQSVDLHSFPAHNLFPHSVMNGAENGHLTCVHCPE